MEPPDSHHQFQRENSDIRQATRTNLLESHYYNSTHFLKITAVAPKGFSNQKRTPNSRIQVVLLSVPFNYFPYHTVPALFAHWDLFSLTLTAVLP